MHLFDALPTVINSGKNLKVFSEFYTKNAIFGLGDIYAEAIYWQVRPELIICRNRANEIFNAYRIKHVGQGERNFRLANDIDSISLAVSATLGNIDQTKPLSFMGPVPHLTQAATADALIDYRKMAKTVTMPLMALIYLKSLDMAFRSNSNRNTEHLQADVDKRISKLYEDVDLCWRGIMKTNEFESLDRADIRRIKFLYDSVFPDYLSFSAGKEHLAKSHADDLQSVFLDQDAFADRFLDTGKKFNEAAQMAMTVKPIISSAQLLNDVGFYDEAEIGRLTQRFGISQKINKSSI